MIRTISQGIYCLVGVFLLAASANAIPEGSYQANAKHGEACGVVVQAKAFAKGVFLNLGKPYPNQEMTVVLWNIPIADIPNVYGKTVCATGKLSQYKGKPRVEIETLQQLRVK